MKKILLMILTCFAAIADANAQDLLWNEFSLQRVNEIVDSLAVQKTTTKPLIGITVDESSDGNKMELNKSYFQAIEAAGGIPVAITLTRDVAGLKQLVDRLDGLMLTGGNDVQPQFFGQEPVEKMGKVTLNRDYNELIVIRLAVKRHLPILGICRGVQMMNVAMGGTLCQDIPSDKDYAPHILHRQAAGKDVVSHVISVEKDSKLAKIIGTQCMVNSFHHQCVKKVAPGFTVTAHATDGVIEALESEQYRFIGVQFHPEGLFRTIPQMFNIFKDFVTEASKKK